MCSCSFVKLCSKPSGLLLYWTRRAVLRVENDEILETRTDSSGYRLSVSKKIQESINSDACTRERMFPRRDIRLDNE